MVGLPCRPMGEFGWNRDWFGSLCHAPGAKADGHTRQGKAMTARASIFDTRPCELGEGPLWHPERKQLFWFDVLGQQLRSRVGDQALAWDFDEIHSAAGWIDRDTLLLASETALWRFDLETGTRSRIVALEADNPATRSNDGRADPMGGYWIGTMGKQAEPGMGKIYRYYRGELRCVVDGLTIPNALCFSGDGRLGYFSDTPTHRVYRQRLDADGWPEGEPELFLDLSEPGQYPDGAVVDREDHIWIALWGSGCVTRYRPDASLDRVVEVGGLHSSCPAFGGDDMTTLFVTTALEHLIDPDPAQGLVYRAETEIKGRAEPKVIV